MLTGQRVDWSSNEDDFNRSVEVLLQRVWADVPGCRAYVLDGRGGDEGIDIGVERDGSVFHIYQLKFFPEGMSGGFVKRRQQVKDSFDTALAHHGPEAWTLITPRNPTSAERRFTLNLRGNRDITVNVWGQSHLDQEVSRFPDLLAALTRTPVVDLMQQMHAEGAAMSRPEDLPERLSKLAGLANSRSPYWGVRLSAEPGITTITLVPKRDDAAEMEPLAVAFEASFGPQQEDLRRRFEELLAFGGSGGVDLPTEVVQSVTMDGPDWFVQTTSNAGVTIYPAVFAEAAPAVLRVVSPEGWALAELPGQVAALTRGSRGFTLEATFQQLDLTLRHEDGVGAGLTLGWQLAGLPAGIARNLLLVYAHIRAGATAEIWVNNRRAAALREPLATSDEAAIPQDTFDFVDDLAVLSGEFGVEFTVPTDFTLLDRLDMRFVRHLVEGRASYSPRIGSLTATLDHEGLVEFTDPRGVYVSMDGAALPVLGRLVPVGTLCAYHHSVRARDAANHLLVASNQEEAQARRVTFEPTDDVPIRLWLAERWADPDAPVVITPWGIDGIQEKLPQEATTPPLNPVSTIGR